MELKLVRRFKGPLYTIGSLYINNVYKCDTIEDSNRGLYDTMTETEIKSKKIYGQTAIPYGEYEVRVTYSPKFKRDLPLLMDVKGFEGIRIHRGNTPEDSSGCIIPGENTKRGMVLNSTKYELELTNLINNANKRGEKVIIKIV